MSIILAAMAGALFSMSFCVPKTWACVVAILAAGCVTLARLL